MPNVLTAQPPASPSREEIRQAILEAQQGIREAAREMEAAQRAALEAQGVPLPADAPEPPTPPTPPGTIVFDGQGGDARIAINGDGLQIIKDGQTVQVPINKVIPQGVVDITLGFFAMVVFVVVGGPLARAFARRLDRKAVAPAVPPEVTQRLAAIEQAVDSVAVEVERISEGQRFTSRLLAERTQPAVPDFVAAQGQPASVPRG